MISEQVSRLIYVHNLIYNKFQNLTSLPPISINDNSSNVADFDIDVGALSLIIVIDAELIILISSQPKKDLRTQSSLPGNCFFVVYIPSMFSSVYLQYIFSNPMFRVSFQILNCTFILIGNHIFITELRALDYIPAAFIISSGIKCNHWKHDMWF